MKAGNTSHLYQLFSRFFSGAAKSDIYYVTDTAKWSFYWDGYYITRGLNDGWGLSARVIQNPWRLRRKIIHFGDRYAYLNGPFRKLHPTNKVFLTWFHGDPVDPNPEMQRVFDTLPEAAAYVQKIVVTNTIARQILADLHIQESKLVTIPLGVDLRRFYPATGEARTRHRTSLGIPHDAICVGSFQKDGAGWDNGFEPKMIKGPDIFLAVVSKLAKEYDNLFVVLTGPARGYVKQGLRKLRIPFIHDYLSDYYDIVPYYQILDLYIIASRCEGGPKSLLESWATGVPVVSTRVGMSADIINHEGNGMLAEVEDVESLTIHAKDILERTGLRERCRNQALKEVRDYDWPLIAKRYFLELYQPVLQQE